MTTLYPNIEPYFSDFIKVSNIHTIYFEIVGYPDGIRVVFLHGGPGGGIESLYRQNFNPN